MINLAVIDNLNIATDTLEFIVQEIPNLSLVARAGNGREAIEMIEKHKPDIVLMDILMLTMDGIDATEIINQYFADTKVILITGFDNQWARNLAIKAGADGYISQFTDSDNISLAIDHVARGSEFFSFKSTH